MRSTLRPPRLWVGATAQEKPRHATWLELFYDLVFVVAISQLAHKLSGDVSPVGFISFVALFVPLWWSWIGTTFYSNRFDSDDLIHRLLMGFQMLAIAALAVHVHHGLGSSSGRFPSLCRLAANADSGIGVGGLAYSCSPRADLWLCDRL